MIIRIFDKMMRELYRLFHPQLWGHHMQINGIPRIYGIEKLKLGQNVSDNAGCVLQCYGKLTIGNNVTVSDGAKILTRSLKTDGYAANAKKTERDHIEKETRIGDGVWIASNAVILPGVTIHKNSIIAAGAVVTKDVEANSVYAGVPAKKIKTMSGD